MVRGGTVQLVLATALACVLAGACSHETAAGQATVRQTAVDGVALDTLMLPNSPTSVKFAVIGDSGRGTKPQRDVADRMTRYHDTFAFSFTIMLGDNLYEGPATPDD